MRNAMALTKVLEDFAEWIKLQDKTKTSAELAEGYRAYTHVPTDNSLIDWYMKGWNDELKGTSSIVPNIELKIVAYKMGADDADSVSLMGDEGHDPQTKEKILEKIKK